MRIIYWIGVVGTVIVAVSLFWPPFFYIFLFVLYSLILIALAIFGTIYVHYKLTNKETNHHARDLPTNVLYNATKSQLFDSPSPPKSAASLPIVFGRTVDNLLQQIIGNAMRDVVSPALAEIVANPRRIVDLLREDIWLGIEKLHERASRIDAPKMIAVDFVIKTTIHLEKIRTAQSRAAELGTEPVFATASYLTSTEKELEFLKKICEILTIFLLPRGYSLSPIKDLLSEVVSYKVLYPIIKLVTSPDFINQQIVECIETKLVAVAINKRSYEYAANFEDFLKIINASCTTEELHSIRGSIVSDIMQATTMQNLQRTRGFDNELFVGKPTGSGNSSGDSESGPSRAEITASLKLKKYIQQLSFAKNQCEKCLSKLGWNGNVSNDVDLSILDILSTVAGRRHFTIFLEPLKASSLVGFYTTVEELKHASKSSWHQLGAEIFYTYIRCPNSEIPVDKSTRKKMESFLVGDSGPEIFYEVQRECLVTMEDKYYHPFLLSEEYAKLKASLTQEDIKEITLNTYLSASTESQDETASNASSASGDIDPVILDLSNHSTYARNKLDQLDEKLMNKNQALDALKQSLKPDSKLLAILEKEIDWLKGEKRQLESHLLRTEVWGEYLGKWRAIVESVDFSDDKEPQPHFMIVVQVDEVNDCGKEDVATAMDAADSISTGWVVVRSLSQFHELHRKLRPMCVDLKAIDLPSNNAFKLFLLKNDKSLLEKAKQQIQKYLNFILEDDHLNQSEALYEFLSPSSERLKQSTLPSPSKKQSKFSLATLFKTNSEKMDQFWGSHFKLNNADFPDDDQVSMYLEGGSNTDSGSSKSQADAEAKDSIAEPLYALLGEIFDMGGVFKWLRRSLISFVQITYGQTINRQIRESINYLFEETMLHTYASTVLKALWPGGVLTVKYIERTEDQEEMTMNAAKSLLLDNIPDLLCNIIGAQNARAGIMKLFDNVQNPIYNKQLFYDLLEILMLELFPEIRQLKVPPSVAAVAVVGGSTSSAASTPTHAGHAAASGSVIGWAHATPTRTILRN
ncbi:sorting nexin-25 [Wyeomyia smithii]|uniref:sorting nexin-25 n=1 Tax=Wyeomyia smithii TaxID=174621 RepID=UPI002467E4F3|nr:sorting nexin-25 [Wyeomyia smithii]XP_055528008.1 sorting nexin-25 [Wyeomyia smithii]